MMKVGDIGVLQNIPEKEMNGAIAEVIGGLEVRTGEYSGITALCYHVKAAYPSKHGKQVGYVFPGQIRPLRDPDQEIIEDEVEEIEA